MDRGAWQATVHGVAKSQTQLSEFTSLHFIHNTGVCVGIYVCVYMCMHTCICIHLLTW